MQSSQASSLKNHTDIDSVSDLKSMSFMQHLSELRQRIILTLAALIIAIITAFIFSKSMILKLQVLVPANTIFVQLSPGEVFLSSFKLSVFAGIGLALPVILYQIFRFVSPGLESREKRFVLPLLILGLALFIAGVTFGYYVILPLMLNFLLDYGQDLAQNQLSVSSFTEFCTGFLFASGLIFQLPLFLLFASLLGFISSYQLVSQWKWAVITSFLLGAIITPSADPFSQIVMAISLLCLYIASIGLIKIFKK